MASIGLIDYGSGNYSSVFNALEYLGLDVIQVREPCDFQKTTHLVLPGVGAFATVMRQLSQANLIGQLREDVLEDRKPFLGICLGMQILADVGNEFESCPGLGYIAGSDDEIDARAQGLPVPHMGWNQLEFTRQSTLFDGIEDSPSFYFVHSYQFNPKEQSAIVATCEYGGNITACVEQDNIFGVQFHPEKSQRAGLQLLKNFARERF
jgi:glutamine amidotransferase